MTSVLILSIIFSVPIVAILSGTYIKSRKMALDKGGVDKAELETLLRALTKLNDENRQLKQRIENLETIVATPEYLEKITERELSATAEIEKLAKLLKKNP
jgi:uncharacterized protein YlxW (UPF0749 family)